MNEIIYEDIEFRDSETGTIHDYQNRRLISLILRHCNALAINMKIIESITLDIKTIPLIHDNAGFMVDISNNNGKVGSFAGYDVKMDPHLWYDVDNQDEYQFVLTCKDGYTKHIIINRDIQRMRERNINEII